MHLRSQVFAAWGLLIAVLCGVPATTFADGPQDNRPEDVRRIPKLGVEVPESDRKELEAELAKLGRQIDMLRKRRHERTEALLPDVLIYYRAVDQALRFQEFFDAKEIPVAKQLVAEGQERAKLLLKGQAPWTRQTGLVAKGYISKIDQTVQPYGLVIPENYDFNSEQPVRLDLWFHGRGETLSEVNFIHQRQTQKGEYAPADTIVLHPYGRYCNANKFAGEIDTFEAIASAKEFYRIDPDRISLRGFSMGGAAVWQFAVHYPDQWFAANPGAGFSESPDFLKVFQNEPVKPSPWEQKLWQWYDCTEYAANLAHLNVIAYSGEIDKQKQAADIMAKAMEPEGLTLQHVIGPMTAHKIHPDSKVIIDEQMAKWAKEGRSAKLKQPLVHEGHWVPLVQLATPTLRYNRMYGLTIDALGEHWSPARVVVEYDQRTTPSPHRVQTKNVTAFTLDPAMFKGTVTEVSVDGQTVPVTLSGTPPLWRCQKVGDRWQASQQLPTLRKQHGLQGPIDDAFMDKFIFVKPGKPGISQQVDAWVAQELNHAVEHWRRHYRGDAIVKQDTEVTPEDMKTANLVLFGDAQSNEIINQLSSRFAVTWHPKEKTITVGDKKYDAATHALVMVYPNPLAPGRYIVTNSGFTFREYDYLNNARQTAKLPDWAIVDITTPPSSRFPGKIVAADFFNEEWQLKK